MKRLAAVIAVLAFASATAAMEFVQVLSIVPGITVEPPPFLMFPFVDPGDE